MNKIIFTALAMVALFIVANSSADRQTRKTSSRPVPNYAVEVTDEALEELRRISKNAQGFVSGSVYRH